MKWIKINESEFMSLSDADSGDYDYWWLNLPMVKKVSDGKIRYKAVELSEDEVIDRMEEADVGTENEVYDILDVMVREEIKRCQTKWNKINETVDDTNEENYRRLHKIVMSANDCIEVMRKEIVNYANTGKLDCKVVNYALEKYHKTIDDNPVVK